VTEILIDALDRDTMALWQTVAKIARALEGDGSRWCLVGGLMVATFALEAGLIQRPTTDIDILSDARQRPSATRRVTTTLKELGARRTLVGGFEGERGFRFEIEGHLIDVLAPDGLSKPAMTDRQFATIEIPGGTQALQRTETITLLIDGEPTLVCRPTLIAAVLLKARSLRVHSQPAGQREDLIMLLSLIDDPGACAEELSPNERRWLRAVTEPLALDGPAPATFTAAQLRSARAALAVLTR
jgi:hypothetical protein